MCQYTSNKAAVNHSDQSHIHLKSYHFNSGAGRKFFRGNSIKGDTNQDNICIVREHVCNEKQNRRETLQLCGKKCDISSIFNFKPCHCVMTHTVYFVLAAPLCTLLNVVETKLVSTTHWVQESVFNLCILVVLKTLIYMHSCSQLSHRT